MLIELMRIDDSFSLSLWSSIILHLPNGDFNAFRIDPLSVKNIIRSYTKIKKAQAQALSTIRRN